MAHKKIPILIIACFLCCLTASAQKSKSSKGSRAILRNSQAYATKLFFDWTKTSEGKDPENAGGLKHLQAQLDSGKVPGPKEMTNRGWLSDIAKGNNWLAEINKGLKTPKDALALIEGRNRARTSTADGVRGTAGRRSKLDKSDCTGTPGTPGYDCQDLSGNKKNKRGKIK